MKMKIKTKLDKWGYLPERAHSTDAGADIFCYSGFTIAARSSAVIRTGVHIELPPNTVGLLMSKSGLNVNHDIISRGTVMRDTLSDGVIDEGYTGEIIAKLYNLGDKPYHFEPHDKITQLIVMPVYYPDFVKADEIGGDDRGSEGFGSTGR